MNINGWKKFEIIILEVAFSVILFNAIVFKDSIVAIISAICGILYTTLAGKGKVSCYYFGLCGSGCYSYLSLKSLLFGNLALYLCYYIPMQILGIFKWKKNLKENSKEIVKTKLSRHERIKLLTISVIASLILYGFLKYFNDASPFIDSVTTIFSIVGMYLTVKRCIEQWLVWIVVNGLSLLMWLQLVLNGTKAYATVVMWAVYFILAFYFYFEWKKEINQNLSDC